MIVKRIILSGTCQFGGGSGARHAVTIGSECGEFHQHNKELYRDKA